MKRISLIFSIVLFLTSVFLPAAPVYGDGPTISLNSAITYQTITGWEATAQAGQQECSSFANYKNTVFDQAVNDLGINRLRVEIRSGAENPVDYFDQWMKGEIDNTVWKAHRYEIINDNSNSNSLNAAGFHFTELDHTMDNVVLPIKQRVEANGEQLFINVNYVDFSTSSNTHYANPAEYAEFVLATYQHLQSKYGIVPNTWEVILEPDNCAWSGSQIGNAIVAAANRLKAAGFANPRFVAPSNTDVAKAITYFDQLIAVPGVHQYLEEFSYHRYGSANTTNIQTVASRGQQYGINTAMLEYMFADYRNLHEDLTVGNNSAWQQFALAFCTEDSSAQYYWVNSSNVAVLGQEAKFLRQYFKFIRKGAVRIGATSDHNYYDPAAFINADGKYVVVVKAVAGGGFSIQGLPGGTYGIKYTTENAYDVDLPDQTISAGQTLSTSIPAAGAITIYAKTSVSTPKPVLALNKQAQDINGGGIEAGDTIRYTIDVTNTGDDTATNVVVTDDLPSQVTCQSVSGDNAPSCEDPLVWSVGNLASGNTSATLTVDVTINSGAEGQEIINTASATADNVVGVLSTCPVYIASGPACPPVYLPLILRH
jgi:uncharacterized repeat protein (TIGR01451 family)